MTSGKKSKENREVAREQARKIAAKTGSKKMDPKKKSLITKISVIGGVIIILAAIVGGILLTNKNSDVDFDGTTTAPANINENGGVTTSFNPVENAPKVSVYLDLQCPACKSFEAENGPELMAMAEKGEIVLEQNPVAILDHLSSSNYASRAGNAYACVVNSYPEKALDFTTKLLEIQPAEMTAGLNNATLAKTASDLGATGLEDCVSGGQYRGWVRDATAKAVEKGLDSTPGIFINDKKWDRQGSIYDAIAAANLTTNIKADPTATTAP